VSDSAVATGKAGENFRIRRYQIGQPQRDCGQHRRFSLEQILVEVGRSVRPGAKRELAMQPAQVAHRDRDCVTVG